MKYLSYPLLISIFILTGNVSAAGGGGGWGGNDAPPAWMSGGPDRFPWGAWPGGPWGNPADFENFAESPPGWGAYPPGPWGMPPAGAFTPWGSDDAERTRDEAGGYPRWGAPKSDSRRRGGMGGRRSPSPRDWGRYPPADKGSGWPERFPRGSRPAPPDTSPRSDDKQEDAPDMMGHPNWFPEGYYPRKQKRRESTKRRDQRRRDYRDYRDYSGPDDAYRGFPAFPDREAPAPSDSRSFMGFPQGFDSPSRRSERGDFRSRPPMPGNPYNRKRQDRDDGKQSGGFRTLPRSMPFPPMPANPFAGEERRGNDDDEHRGGFRTLPGAMPFPPMPANPFAKGGSNDNEQPGGFRTLPPSMPFPPLPANPFARGSGDDDEQPGSFQIHSMPFPPPPPRSFTTESRAKDDKPRSDGFQAPRLPSQPVKRDKENNASEAKRSAAQRPESSGGFQTLPESLSFPVPPSPAGDEKDKVEKKAASPAPKPNTFDKPRHGGFVSLPPGYPFPDMATPDPAAFPGYGPAYFEDSPDEATDDE